MELTDRQRVRPQRHEANRQSIPAHFQAGHLSWEWEGGGGRGGMSWALRKEARKERREDPSVLIEADTERARTDTTEEGGKSVYLLCLMVKRVACWKPDGNSTACVRTSTISCRLRYTEQLRKRKFQNLCRAEGSRGPGTPQTQPRNI